MMLLAFSPEERISARLKNMGVIRNEATVLQLVDRRSPLGSAPTQETIMHEEKQDGETVTHLSTAEARSGSRTKVTRNILVVSLILVVLAFIIALASGFFETAQTGADDINADNTARNEMQ
jgi:Flp pilus assembly protein TadB